MSEWKRNRRITSGYPKALQKGMLIEARVKDGRTIVGVVGSTFLAHHFGRNYQLNDAIVSYRTITSEPDAEPAKPDYSNGFPAGTTAKDIGAKVGDEFVVVEQSQYFEKGEVITLAIDDGSSCPLFNSQITGNWYANFCFLAPIPQKTAIELQAEEVGIPEPVQYVNDGDTSPEHVEKQQEIEHMPTTAPHFLQSALSTLTQRGKDYDKPEGERSAAAVAVAFNAITGKQITDAEVYLVLQLVKDVRQWQCADFHADSALDCVAYAALKAEALASGSK